MGKALAGITAIIGLTMMAIGLIGVAPVGPTTSPAISNPRFLFAAGIWVLGIMIVFLTPVSYLLSSKE